MSRRPNHERHTEKTSPREGTHAHEKKEKAKAAATKQREALKKEIVKEMAPEARTLKDIPALTAHPERLPDARAYLHESYLAIMQRYNQSFISPPTTPKRIMGRPIMGSIIDDDNFDRYLPLMTKESGLNPASTSASGAIGYFQVTPIALDEINAYFDVSLTADALRNPKQNCVAGILYYELLIATRVNSQENLKGLMPQDKKLMALAMYNAGPGIVTDVWRHLRATSYSDFEKKLSVELALKLGTQQKGPQRVVDPLSRVAFTQVPGLDNYLAALQEKSPKLARNVTFGTHTISVQKIGEMLRYGRLVEGMGKLPIETPLPTPVHTPTPGPTATPPEAPEVSSMPKDYLERTETYSENHKLWSMAEVLRAELVQVHYKGISGGQTPENRTNDREFLVAALGRFNREYNPQFETVNEELNNILNGMSISIPTKAYLDIFKKDFEKDAESAEEEVEVEIKMPAHAELLKEVPLYKDRRLDEAGNKILENYSRLSLTDIKSYANLHLRPLKHPRTSTNYIVLHSTEMGGPDRGAEGTAAAGRAHYVVNPDGKIYAARNERENFDPVGRFRNLHKPKSTAALWNDETDMSGHSISIEVGALPNEEWNEKQYKAVKRLVHALGERYHISAKNVLTHSQVACSPWGRGRKHDPANVHWDKLGLPNNYLLVDTAVVRGRIKPNFSGITRDWGSNKLSSDQQARMTEGLRYSAELKETYHGKVEAAQQQTTTQWKKEMLERGAVLYTVRKGDTLIKIARRHQTSVRKIQVLNDLRWNKLTPNTTIKLPNIPK